MIIPVITLLRGYCRINGTRNVPPAHWSKGAVSTETPPGFQLLPLGEFQGCNLISSRQKAAEDEVNGGVTTQSLSHTVSVLTPLLLQEASSFGAWAQEPWDLKGSGTLH